MALYVTFVLIGAMTLFVIFVAAQYVLARSGVAEAGTARLKQPAARWGSDETGRRWSAHVGSLEDPDLTTPAEEVPMWKRHIQATESPHPRVYKSRPASPFSGDHWDPFDESQSTASRARAARRKPRPHRVPTSVDPQWGIHGGDDPYEVLGVSRIASSEEIERAYRRRVSAIHPDKFHGDPERRQEANEMLKQLNAAMRRVRERRRPAPDSIV